MHNTIIHTINQKTQTYSVIQIIRKYAYKYINKHKWVDINKIQFKPWDRNRSKIYMLHKSSSLKTLNNNHHTVQASMINWQSVRKDMVSAKPCMKVSTNVHSNANGSMNQSHNMQQKIAHLYRLLQQEKASRQKDYLMMSDKIKNIKCRHQVVVIDKQKQKQRQKVGNVNKQSSIKTAQTNNTSTLHHTKSSNMLRYQAVDMEIGADVNEQQYRQNREVKSKSKINRINKMKQSIDRALALANDSRQKIEQHELRIGSMEKLHRNQQQTSSARIDAVQQSISKIQLQIQTIQAQLHVQLHRQLKQQLPQLISNILQSSSSCSSQEHTLRQQQMDIKIAQLQQSTNQSIAQIEHRCIKQISTLGEIINSNLQNMHKSISADIEHKIADSISKLNDDILKIEQIEYLSINQDTLRNCVEDLQHSVMRVEDHIAKYQQQRNQHNSKLVAVEGSNLHINTTIASIKQQVQQLSTQYKQTAEQIQLIKTQQTIPSCSHTHIQIQTSPSLLSIQPIPTPAPTHQQAMLKQCMQHDHRISQLMQLLAENCNYLETKSVAMEDSIREIVIVINNLLIKFKKYL